MEVSVSILKDVAELVTTTSDALKSLLEALTEALGKGATGVDNVAPRRERRRLVDLSARLTDLPLILMFALYAVWMNTWQLQNQPITTGSLYSSHLM